MLSELSTLKVSQAYDVALLQKHNILVKVYARLSNVQDENKMYAETDIKNREHRAHIENYNKDFITRLEAVLKTNNLELTRKRDQTNIVRTTEKKTDEYDMATMLLTLKLKEPTLAITRR